MLGNKKKEGNGPARSGAGPVASGGHNSLVKGTSVEGTIKSENDIRIDGSIKGKLFCKSKVVIGPTGHVEGEIKCKDAVIEGSFDGNIHVEELLNVRSTAKVSGDVVYGKLTVERGGVLNGTYALAGSQQAQRRDTPEAAASHHNNPKKESDKIAPQAKT